MNLVCIFSSPAKSFDIDLNEPSVYFQFASKIFNTEYMSYLINSSEEKRLSELEADINGKLGTEYYEVIDEEWIWKYLAANILFGVLGTKSVDSALTKRRNKPSFNKKGKETLQGSRIFAETTTNLEYCPGVGRFMTLRISLSNPSLICSSARSFMYSVSSELRGIILSLNGGPS